MTHRCAAGCADFALRTNRIEPITHAMAEPGPPVDPASGTHGARAIFLARQRAPPARAHPLSAVRVVVTGRPCFTGPSRETPTGLVWPASFAVTALAAPDPTSAIGTEAGGALRRRAAGGVILGFTTVRANRFRSVKSVTHSAGAAVERGLAARMTGGTVACRPARAPRVTWRQALTGDAIQAIDAG